MAPASHWALLSLCPWEGARHNPHLTDEETEVQHPVREQEHLGAQSTRTRYRLGTATLGYSRLPEPVGMTINWITFTPPLPAVILSCSPSCTLFITVITASYRDATLPESGGVKSAVPSREDRSISTEWQHSETQRLPSALRKPSWASPLWENLSPHHLSSVLTMGRERHLKPYLFCLFQASCVSST